VRVDIPAAKAVFASWPTPIVASGFEIGLSILYPATSIEMHYRSVDHHPIADAYRAYKKMPYDRPTWDLTAVLYAVRTSGGYFTLWKPGRIGVDEAGKTSFVEAPDGPHRYLLVDAEGRRKALEQMINLASRPPDHRLGIPVLR